MPHEPLTEEEFRKRIGAFASGLRKERKLSCIRLGVMFGSDGGSVSKFERGFPGFSTHWMYKLFHALGVPFWKAVAAAEEGDGTDLTEIIAAFSLADQDGRLLISQSARAAKRMATKTATEPLSVVSNRHG